MQKKNAIVSPSHFKIDNLSRKDVIIFVEKVGISVEMRPI